MINKKHDLKVAILVMSTDSEPSLRNMEAFENTVIKDYNEHKEKFKNEYDFYIYSSDNTSTHTVNKVENRNGLENVFSVSIGEVESVYRTYEKTYRMLDYMYDLDYYDMVVRINISMWLNMKLLDYVMDQFENDKVYCNAINSYVNINSEYVNDIYPRGDMFIMSKDTLKQVVEKGEKYLYCDTWLKNRLGVDHVDDCILGVVLIDVFGKDYYQHLVALRYNFFPMEDLKDAENIDGYSIGSRVKTVPPGKHSGYSWDDNEYRKKDGEKMHALSELFGKKSVKYHNVNLKNLETNERNERPTLFVQASNQSVKGVFWNVLKQKRG